MIYLMIYDLLINMQSKYCYVYWIYSNLLLSAVSFDKDGANNVAWD